ncbi:MAG: hypothetical protein IPO94_13680 [Saprospiraceae bacterium]|nr:hypothetical protein [Saprospiraceae bacterium]
MTAQQEVFYLWNTGATTASISVNPNVGSTYTVTVTNRFRCTDDATATVNVSPLPNASISGNNICVLVDLPRLPHQVEVHMFGTMVKQLQLFL